MQTFVTLTIIKKALICGCHFLRRWKQTNSLRHLNHSLLTTEVLPRSLWPSKFMFFYNTFLSPPFSKLAMTPNVIVFISRTPQPLQMAEPLAAFLEDSQGLKQHEVFEVPLQPLLCSSPSFWNSFTSPAKCTISVRGLAGSRPKLRWD